MRRIIVSLGIVLSVLASSNGEAEEKKPTKKSRPKIVTGKADYLRSLPKHFAKLLSIDLEKNEVTLLLEGKEEPQTWPLADDGQVWLHGWWGRLGQLTPNDRVWIWLKTNRKKKPVALAMICDEITEQDWHTRGMKVMKVQPDSITVKEERLAERAIPAKDTSVAKVDDLIYIQTNEGKARMVLTPADFEKLRTQQQAKLRERWLKEGLPARVSYLHPVSGEMEIAFDHEAMRWARSLAPKTKVTLAIEDPISGEVKHTHPYRERTIARLVVQGNAQMDLTLGQRIYVKVPTPSTEVEASKFPPGMDLPRAREERLDWFLANIYCTCYVRGDGCTGHFFTLSGCNPNTCRAPLNMKRKLEQMIDEKKTDRQIMEQLYEKYGDNLLRPHMLR